MESVSPEAYGVVYHVTHEREPDRVRYVGQTTLGVTHRARGHWNDAGRYGNRTRMSAWLNKHRSERGSIRFEVVQTCYSREELNAVEIAHIFELRGVGQADLNLTDGGEGHLGAEFTEGHRRKISDASRGAKSHLAKTTWAVVRNAREDYIAGVKSNDVAKRYGLDPSNARKILRNVTWVDPNYSPPSIEELGNRGEFSNSRISWETVNEMRRRACEVRKRAEDWGVEYGMTYGQARSILSGKTFKDPTFDPKRVRRNNAHQVLEVEDVRRIRSLRGVSSAQSIADEYGLRKNAILRIWSGESWKDVD